MSEHFNVTGRRQAQSWHAGCFKSSSTMRLLHPRGRFFSHISFSVAETLPSGRLSRRVAFVPQMFAQILTLRDIRSNICVCSVPFLGCSFAAAHPSHIVTPGIQRLLPGELFEHYLLFSFALSWADSLFTSSASQWGILYWGQGQNSLENSEEFLFQNKVPWSRSVDFPFGCCKSFETRNNKQTPNQSSRSCFPFGEKGRRCHNLP